MEHPDADRSTRTSLGRTLALALAIALGSAGVSSASLDHDCACAERCAGASCCCRHKAAKAPEAAAKAESPATVASPSLQAAPCERPGLPGPSTVQASPRIAAWAGASATIEVESEPLDRPGRGPVRPEPSASTLDEPPEA